MSNASARLLTIDGSKGEGGGQILRTSLTLAMITGVPFHITRIRERRARPGLRRQHLAAVDAAAEVSSADVDGAMVGSRELEFRPGAVKSGNYRFMIGTAGSTGLVLQTVLPALALASRSSTVTVEGGTHNPGAPPFDFLTRSFLPLLERMGPRIEARLDRPGFYPAGGGQCTITVTPHALSPITLLERGALRRHHARAIVSRLPRRIAERELSVVRHLLGWEESALEIVSIEQGSRGPGNVVMLEIESEHVTETFTGFGERELRAEIVAERAATQARRYLDAGVPVGPHLADQLLVPLALAGGTTFRTTALTEHSTTNMRVITTFLGTRFTTHGDGDDVTVEITAK